MDDPLRPKTVPLAAETVLWFEFLLDPELITKHLKKPHPEPTAAELLTQFISMAPDTVTNSYDLTTPARQPAVIAPNDTPADSPADMPVDIYRIPLTPGSGPGPIVSTGNGSNGSTEDGLKITRKQLALKILALKVATWLKWNLDMLEKTLPIPKQLFLLRDLCSISFGRLISVPLPVDFKPRISPDGDERASCFALTFYHRWVLRLQILKDIAIKSARQPMGNIYIPMEPMHQYCAPEINPQASIEYLQELCKSSEPFYIFTYDTFPPLHPNSESTHQKFDAMVPISQAELRAQIYFDLVNFYLYTKQYTLARDAVNNCRRNMNELKVEYEKGSDFVFCHINEQELEGYLMACGVSTKKMTLMERFNLAQLTQYHDIVEVLQLDNREREIPLVNRRILELDIAAATSQGALKDSRMLEMQVAALNLVRGILEEGNIFNSVDYFEKYGSFNSIVIFMQYVANALALCTPTERDAIKDFIIDFLIKFSGNKQFVAQVEGLQLFTPEELKELQNEIQEEEVVVPPLASLNDWKFQSKVGALERQLISCTNANAVRKLLVKLAASNVSPPLWAINPSWEIPMPIRSVLMSLQRGFMQDFAYVLVGKSRELTAKNDFVGAVSMLSVLRSETQRQELCNASTVAKLGKLVNWEILFVQITQCLEEWHRKTLDLQALATRCKQCLASLQSGDNVLPRIEVIDACALMLLNLNDCVALMTLDKRLPQLELAISFAATILDMEKMKVSNKIRRDSWDLVLSMFLNKRCMPGGGSSSNSRSSPCLAVSSGLQPFLKRIRNQTLFSLVISLLGKIHNILKDDPNHDLNGEYVQLWPATISTPLSYSIRSVSETLHWLLTEALRYYPQTISWLKMKGDLELAIGNNEAAMRCYVNALITGTDYCTIPLQRNIADDYVIRKMIRCCSNLGCYMQATVLCQFMEEIDYNIVIKNLQEKTLNFTDAMDAYYNCIWDTTLLEFIINFHARKGEHARKLEAISVMGTLELNANNNEEVKREAAAIRKSRFMRALAKQYLL